MFSPSFIFFKKSDRKYLTATAAVNREAKQEKNTKKLASNIYNIYKKKIKSPYVIINKYFEDRIIIMHFI